MTKELTPIMINETPLCIKEYNGKRVVTFKDIDEVHGRPEGTARKRFNNNKKHFIEGIDYFFVLMSAKRTLGFDVPNRGLILITESGYLMLVKSFTDDFSWTVQRELVNNYFYVQGEKQSAAEPLPEGSDYHYFPKTHNGIQVITLRDFEHFTGISADAWRRYVEMYCKSGKDYFILKRAELTNFKVENPAINKSVGALEIVTEAAAKKLATYYNCVNKIPIALKEREQPARNEITVEALPPISETHTDEALDTAEETLSPELINLRKAELLVKMSESKELPDTAKAEALSSAYELITGSSFSQKALNCLPETSETALINAHADFTALIFKNSGKFNASADSWGEHTEEHVAIFKEQFDKMCSEIKIEPKPFLRWLLGRGYIEADSQGQYTKPKIINGKVARCVILNMRL